MREKTAIRQVMVIGTGRSNIMLRSILTICCVIGMFACAASENLVSNGGFEAFGIGKIITGGTNAATISTASGNSGYDQFTATSALPYYGDATYRSDFSREGYVVKFTSGSLNGQTTFVTEDITTDLKTDMTMSFESLGSLPLSGDTLEVYTAHPNSWTPFGGGFVAHPPASRSDDAYTGSYSLRIDDYGNNSGIKSSSIAVTAGRTYELSYWCKASNTDGIKVGVEIKDASNTTIILLNGVEFAATANTWEYRQTKWIPADNVTIVLSADETRTKNKHQWVQFDDVSFVILPTGTLITIK